jgi:hypothetical protein
MDTPQQEGDDMGDVFKSLVEQVLPNKLITNFILIAEVADDKSTQLSVSVSDNMTPWLGAGMVQSAMEIMLSGEYNFHDSEESE